MNVEIWSDVVCPWCYIGKRRFEAAAERFREAHPDEPLDVRYRAFLLDPRAPVGESQPVRDAYARKFGGPEAADAIMARLTDEAATEGLEFHLDIAKRSNTVMAHRLLVLADELARGEAGGNGDGDGARPDVDPELQLKLKERFLSAYFVEGEAIGDPEVLIELSSEVGIDREVARQWLESGQGRDEVADQLEMAAGTGLGGVPTFVFDRKISVEGAQDPNTLFLVMERALTLGS
jgi:predicted DsbA family dithiol-disulfide isomerase